MFYGPNSKVKYGGENAPNYMNKSYDQLFEQLNKTKNNNEKKMIINKMVKILQYDAPWIFGYHPMDYILQHKWNAPIKPNSMARNTLKYAKIDYKLRAKKQKEWNKPITYPFYILFFLLLLIIILPAIIGYVKSEQKLANRDKKL